METPVFIAKVLGPCFLAVSLGMMFNKHFYQKVMEDYCKNAALIFFGGITAFVFGVVIVILHNVWVADWRVIITIYGWGGIIKGAWLILFPESVSRFMEAYLKNKNLLTLHSILAFLLSVALVYFGYFAA